MFEINQYSCLVKYTGDTHDVVIPNGVQRIKSGAFNVKLDSVVLPETLLNIENVAFSGQDRLKEVLIPDSVKSIGDGAFMNCTSLQQVRLPAAAEYIGEKCFQNSGLKELMIPGGTGFIRYGAFSGCPELETVYVAEGVRTLTDTCFEFCPRLHKVTVPASVIKIGYYTFRADENVVLYVTKGSYAELYAVKHGIPCKYQNIQQTLS